jgi:hypothetical protein
MGESVCKPVVGESMCKDEVKGSRLIVLEQKKGGTNDG